ncbi:MAG: hypothetical protein LLG37_03830 [Spirochaetia bacterium]|nr:hypothetical protein [Spirochaetia bacterium]
MGQPLAGFNPEGLNSTRVRITCSGEAGININDNSHVSAEDGVIKSERFRSYRVKAAKTIHDNGLVLVTVYMGNIKYNGKPYHKTMFRLKKSKFVISIPSTELAGLANGIYYLYITTESQNAGGKILKPMVLLVLR